MEQQTGVHKMSSFILCLSVLLMTQNAYGLKYESKLMIDSVKINGSLEGVDVSVKIINQEAVDVNVSVHKMIKDRLIINAELWTIVGGKFQLITKFADYDFCKLLRNSGRGSVLKVMYQKLKQRTFIPWCPVEKGFYQLKDYSIDPEYMPFRLLPAGKYHLINNLSRSDGEVILESFKVFCDLRYEKYLA